MSGRWDFHIIGYSPSDYLLSSFMKGSRLFPSSSLSFLLLPFLFGKSLFFDIYLLFSAEGPRRRLPPQKDGLFTFSHNGASESLTMGFRLYALKRGRAFNNDRSIPIDGVHCRARIKAQHGFIQATSSFVWQGGI